MSEPNQKMIFHVKTVRTDAHRSVAHCKSADITLDTDLAGRTDAFNHGVFAMLRLSVGMPYALPAGSLK